MTPASRSQTDPNLSVYNAPEVAAHYGALQYLSPAERLLFERYLQSGNAILDLGVGGGRTTPYLNSIASRYTGVDYASEMVEVCRRKFPEIPFVVADATNLKMFADASFDAIVMAFNGFDYVMPDTSRRVALSEMRRVLRIGGLFIFSSHNPRAILQRPSWNQQRIEALASRIAGSSQLFLKVGRAVLSGARIAVALVTAFGQSVRRLFRAVVHRAFWLGHGYMHDAAHGGLMTHYAVPHQVERELQSGGFELLEVLGDDYPKRSHVFVTPWYYYVFKSKPLAGQGSEKTACA